MGASRTFHAMPQLCQRNRGHHELFFRMGFEPSEQVKAAPLGFYDQVRIDQDCHLSTGWRSISRLLYAPGVISSKMRFVDSSQMRSSSSSISVS